MRNFKRVLILLACVFVFPLSLKSNEPSASESESLTGKEVIEKVYNRPTGEDQIAKLTMTLINSRGNERVREIKQYYKDFGDNEKKIMFFISPADVRNTSFMNWSYDEAGKNDDQWIYLPALKRVRRISSDSSDDYFMGSDFTYDDLGERHPDEDNHELLRAEEKDGVEYYVIESIPKEEDYMYSKTVTRVIKDRWIGEKKEFYDEDGKLLKTLKVKNYEEIGGYLIVTNVVMHNVQKDHRTEMKFEDIEIDTGVSDNQFTERMMRRGL